MGGGVVWGDGVGGWVWGWGEGWDGGWGVQVSKLENHLEQPKKQEVHNKKMILLKIDAQSFPEADSASI